MSRRYRLLKNCWHIHDQHKPVWQYLFFETPNSDFQPFGQKKGSKNSFPISSQAKDLTKTWFRNFFYTTQVTKLIWLNFSSACSRLVAWTFKNTSKNAIFAVILLNFWKLYNFTTTSNAISLTVFCVFITFCLRYHNLLFSSTFVNIRANSEKI